MQQLTIKPCLKLIIYIFYTKEFEIWYVIYYKLNEMHDGFIIIREEVFKNISYISIYKYIIVLMVTF